MSLIDRKRAIRWLRVIHRDLGFLMVGVCLVYGISGVLMNHMNGKDPVFKTEKVTVSLVPGLEKESLAAEWKSHPELPPMKKILLMDDGYRVTFQGGMGAYNLKTGSVEYEKSTKRPFIYWINKLHYNQVKGWRPMADIFAVALIFFAISGLLIVPGRKGLSGSGKWYLLIGLLIPVLYILLLSK